MPGNILQWPKSILRWRECGFVPHYMARSGGQALNSYERTTRTDRGYWIASFGPVVVETVDQWRLWQSIDIELGGRPGLVLMPAYNIAAPYKAGFKAPETVLHDDETSFEDGTAYEGQEIVLEVAKEVAIGATTITLKIINSGPDLTGIRFSYNYALYQTGAVIDQSGNLVTLRIFPAARTLIPKGAQPNCDKPVCLMHLKTDAEMQIAKPMQGPALPSLNLVEALDYFNDLAGT